jgi:hypothetical protein
LGAGRHELVFCDARLEVIQNRLRKGGLSRHYRMTTPAHYDKGLTDIPEILAALDKYLERLL